MTTITPWGTSQHATELIPGIVEHSTAGHGGIKVHSKYNKRIPEYMQNPNGWYEEDCEWCIPFVVLENDLMLSDNEMVTNTLKDKSHISTFRDWFPSMYESFFNVTLKPGESSERDREIFHIEHKDDWVGISASGDWKKGVPKGMVEVIATKGGNRNPGIEEKLFLVPTDEYKIRKYGFLIDLHRHKEITPIN